MHPFAPDAREGGRVASPPGMLQRLPPSRVLRLVPSGYLGEFDGVERSDARRILLAEEVQHILDIISPLLLLLLSNIAAISGIL